MVNMDRRDEWRTEELEQLCDALLAMDTRDELAWLLRDLCTEREISELSSRWQVVLKLEAGIPYRQIAEETGTSTATITRVNQWRQHGLGGYQLAVERTGAASDVG